MAYEKKLSALNEKYAKYHFFIELFFILTLHYYVRAGFIPQLMSYSIN